MKKLLLIIAMLALVLPLAACQKKVAEVGEVVDDSARRAFLNDYVYFDFDRYNIRSDQTPKMDAKASYLKMTGSSSQLVGYADERGTEAYNLALGDRRSKSAANYLVSQGVSAAKLSTDSGGESNPRDPGHDEAAWALNRRVEFTLY
ncbi:MAG: OmpA family protein [Deltaproteobacteria bacterium]|jgi:peptidoglycan-associated lipoprotein|nr:OmpA family protein [Deltaproteobacteria bacterium]